MWHSPLYLLSPQTMDPAAVQIHNYAQSSYRRCVLRHKWCSFIHPATMHPFPRSHTPKTKEAAPNVQTIHTTANFRNQEPLFCGTTAGRVVKRSVTAVALNAFIKAECIYTTGSSSAPLISDCVKYQRYFNLCRRQFQSIRHLYITRNNGLCAFYFIHIIKVVFSFVHQCNPFICVVYIIHFNCVKLKMFF